MTQYGSEKILPYNQDEHKGVQVRRMFDAIAGKYDLLNHTLSFGFDKGWRRKGIRFLRRFAFCALIHRSRSWILRRELGIWLLRCRNNCTQT